MQDKRKSTHPNSPHLCSCRLVLPFVPELNTGRRYQNTFLAAFWLLEINSYINSSFNIFVYYSMGSRYREMVKAIFCKRRLTTSASREETTAISSVNSTNPD